jgi:histone acetyltransferase (RNA polymerase elongator complex component)
MPLKDKAADIYRGFEQGPIRPPSEARSLLIRITRNCPWNRCTFCRVYKEARFSIRPVEHVKKDIDAVHRYMEILRGLSDDQGRIDGAELKQAAKTIPQHEVMAFNAAINWVAGGMSSIFIQDANSLVIKPGDFLEILIHIRKRFPWVERITSYARSHTIARIKDADLKSIGEAGLNRIHIGMESGSDEVLKRVQKGVSKETHIKAGLRVKRAGIELSEYVMPGLGGRALSDDHALETADALNRIDPEFIRLRTLAIPNNAGLFADWDEGRFEKCSDIETVREILLFIESLDGITSTVKSDHILNLLQDVEGTLPRDKPHMVDTIKRFLEMEPRQQCVYQVGRRLGLFAGLKDMESPARLERARKSCREMGITPDNIDGFVDEIIKRFI